MLALLGSLLGLFSSALPTVLQIFTRAQDHRHEIALMSLQMQAQRELAAQRVEEVRVQADAAEMAALSAEQVALIHAQAQPTGVRWVDAVSSLVRPTITLLFLIDYIVLKAAQFLLMQNSAIEWTVAVGQLWTETDYTILATIMSFWFGDRAFRRQNS